MTKNPLARPLVVHIELTSRCNLKCTYCAVSQPEYVGRDLPLEELWPAWLDDLAALNPTEVHLNGHGEATLFAGWRDAARALLARGLPVRMQTNLSRPLDAETVDLLLQFDALTVSCDTADPELHQRIRRGSRLSVIERNMDALYERSRELDGMKPFISINAVVSDVTVPGLPDLVRWTSFLRADALALVNFIPYPAVSGAEVALHHPSSVRDEALASIRKAERLAHEFQITLNVMPGLRESLAREPETEAATAAPPSPAPSVGSTDAPEPDAPPGTTRDCLDPWRDAWIEEGGGVGVCCWRPSVGSLVDGTLDDVLNGPSARDIRARLLSGDLDSACSACPARGRVPVEVLRDKVDRLEEERSTELQPLRADRNNLRSEIRELQGHSRGLVERVAGLEENQIRLEEDRAEQAAAYAVERDELLREISALRDHAGQLERRLAKIRRNPAYRLAIGVKDSLPRPSKGA